MLKYLLFLYILIVAAFLTVATQIGGVVYLLSWIVYLLIRPRTAKKYPAIIIRSGIFVCLYLAATFLVVPPIARKFGKVRLPLVKTKNVQPVTVWTALLNRNYVRPQLLSVVYSVAEEMNARYPGTTINYMDANFPFVDGFPLLPHISHNDGKKLDVAFHYMEKISRKRTDRNPSFIGYGASEPPREGETDRPAVCAKQGYWIYSYMYRVMPLSEDLMFDEKRTREMIQLFYTHNSIQTLYLEPHLKQRLRLTSQKIRLHACYSVRHDDHVHVQL